jgi:hypothetical protein
MNKQYAPTIRIHMEEVNWIEIETTRRRTQGQHVGRNRYRTD